MSMPTVLLCDAESALKAAAGDTALIRLKYTIRRAAIVKERIAQRDVSIAHVPDVACAVDVLTKWVANSLTFHTLFSPTALQSTVDCSVSRAHTFMFSLYVAEISHPGRERQAGGHARLPHGRIVEAHDRRGGIVRQRGPRRHLRHVRAVRRGGDRGPDDVEWPRLPRQ